MNDIKSPRSFQEQNDCEKDYFYLEGKLYDTYDVNINNPWYIERLDGFLKELQKLDPTTLEVDDRAPSIDKHEACSDEYLDKMLGIGKVGWPKAVKGTDLIAHPPSRFPKWNKIKREIAYDFARELNAQQNALLCHYPEDGYISWHTNFDAPGYSLLFTWSETGDGYYKYRSKTTGKIGTLNDKPGWICRTSYYGHQKENWQWHCALTNEPRWSIAFYLRDADMTRMVIEDIESFE